MTTITTAGGFGGRGALGPPRSESEAILQLAAVKPPGSPATAGLRTKPVSLAPKPQQSGESLGSKAVASHGQAPSQALPVHGSYQSSGSAFGSSLALLLTLLLNLGGHPLPVAAAPAAAATGALGPLPTVSADFDQRVLEVLQRHPEAVFEALQIQLRRLEQKKQQARETAFADLQRNPAAAIGSSPTRGQGQVRLIEFSDFQCPYCAAASNTLRAFLANNSSKLSLTYKFYPLERIHPEALPSARAAWAAQQQGKFWAFHDALFAGQERLGEPLYLEIARNLGLDLKRFNADRQGPASLEAINRDRELADRLGLEGTPFFVVNGQAVPGAVDEAFLQKLVEGR